MHMTSKKKFAAVLSIMLLSAALNFGSMTAAQELMFAPGDTFTIVIPDTVGVQADWDSTRNRYDPNRLHTDVTTTDVSEAGYYRIIIKILYNSGDEQTNETFFMDVKHPDGTVVSPADSNAGPHKIVFDDPGPRHTAFRDAGLFYFKEGVNTLQMHHIASIMDEYPHLLNGPLGPSESVKVTDSLKIISELAPGRKVDLGVSLTSETGSTALINGDSVSAVNPGGNIDYTLTLFNNSPDTADYVSLSNLLPADFNLETISLSPTRTSGDFLVWEFPIIEPFSTVQILYSGTADTGIAKEDSLLLNWAELSSPEDSTAFNNIAEDTVLVKFPAEIVTKNVDLGISLDSKTDSTIFVNGDSISVVMPGGDVNYTLTLFNNSPDTAKDVTLANLPPTRFNVGTISLEPTRSSGDSLIWEFPSIEPNGSRQILYDGTVDVDVPESDSLLIATAELFSPNDTTAFNNAAEDTALIQFPFIAPNENVDLSISLVSNTDSTVTRNGKEISLTHPGGDVEYTLTIFNQTPKTARDITLVNVISPYFDVSDISRTPNRAAGDSLIWNVPSLNPFASLQIVYSGTVDISFPEDDSLLIADAELFSPNDTTEYNNSASDTALVKEQPIITEKFVDVGVTLFSNTASSVFIDGDTVNVTFPDGLIEYTLTVFNNGPDSATNVILTNLLSSDFTLDDISLTPDEISGNLLTWNISVMAPSSEIEIQYNGTAASGLNQDDLIISMANVDAPNDTTAFNNSDSDSVLIQIPVFEPPKIEATPSLVDVTDSISVRVQIPPNTASWDLWIRFPDGGTATDFADEFIFTNTLTPDVWYEVDENYNPEFLITTAKREPLIFEIRATDIFGTEASAQSIVEVISSNYLVLDRNVFRPEAETPLGIRFKLSNRRIARLDIYDIAGRHITKLTEDVYQGGWNTYPWDGIAETGQRAGSGVYLVTLRSGEFNSWKKFIIVR